MVLLCASVFRNGLKEEEFLMVLEDLRIPKKRREEVLDAFRKFDARMETINSIHEMDDPLSLPSFKKFPLNMKISDENMAFTHGRLVDVEWRILYSLNKRNVNKVF